MDESQKPRIAAYGLYVIDPHGVALRAWLDYRKQIVCTVPMTLGKGWVVWAYCLDGPRQVLAQDLCDAVTRAGYRCFTVSPVEAADKLRRRYDVENAYPIKDGETAGIKDPTAKPGRVRRVPGASDPGMFG